VEAKADSHADPITLLRRLAERWERGDADGAAALFAPDAIYDEPRAFSFVGREAIRAFFADFAARHRDVRFELVRTLAAADGALVAAEWRFAHTRTADGIRKVYEGMSWIALTSGQITRWHGYSALVSAPPM
jgi:uncharacterized protein (TIGR02246 family)